jgi:DNA (cytosine-5)-methyltransferase 1
MKIYFIDLFCGAGGVTSGIHRALYNGRQFAEVIACVNHDPLAIASHAENHPGVLHYTEDIRTLDLTDLRLLVEMKRKQEPDCLIFIWASLECTNFSKAKGGLPRDADSRTLADHMPRYLEELQPDGMWIENVEEFMSWGPLDEKGKPISKRNGEDYIRWINNIQDYGYNFDYRILNAADYGAYTSRRRYFAQFMREGIPIVWPEPSHAKNPAAASMFGGLKKWNAVKNVLDFSDEGKSIFGRKKPLSEKTLERIYAGLIKYVAGGKDAFIAKHFSGKPMGKVIPVDGPAGTITTWGGQSLVLPVSILKYNSMTRRGVHVPPSVEQPAPTVACQDRIGIIQAAFLANYYSNGGETGSIDAPACTISTKDRIAKVQAVWLDKYHSGVHNHQPIPQPGAFLMGTNYDNKPTSLSAPSPTVTASRKWSYLVNPSWGAHPTGTDQPSPVIVARQDKAPMYMVMAVTGEPRYSIVIGRSVADVKIRQFMAIYGIIDIKMRMLKIPELLRIQGFGEGYKLKGNQSDQKRFIGNAVEVNQATVLVEAMYNGIVNYRELKTA